MSTQGILYSIKVMPKRKTATVAICDLTDEALVGVVLSGKKKQYQELVKRYQGKLLVYLRHLIGLHDESEDLLQNVFIKVYEHLDDFDQTRKFSSWIYRIAHNEAVNYLKKKSRRRLVAWEDIMSSKDKLDTADEKESVEALWIRGELRDEVNLALDKLPKKYQEVLILRYYLDKTYTEMADITGRPENTVATLLNRAKKKLLVQVNAGREL